MVIVLVALGVIAVLKQRNKALTAQAVTASTAAVPMPTNPNVDNNVQQASEMAAHWAENSPGLPSIPGTARIGRGYTPGRTSQFLKGPGIISGPVPVHSRVWSAPKAGEGPEQKPSWPGGRLPNPGPFPPASGNLAYVQSAVRSESPYLPNDLALITPLAANTFFYNLSAVDPYVALAAGSGGYIDVQRVDPAKALIAAVKA